MFLSQANPGRLHITNQRVIFEPTSAINLFLKNGKSYKLTGMYNKKLISYMEEVNITRKEK